MAGPNPVGDWRAEVGGYCRTLAGVLTETPLLSRWMGVWHPMFGSVRALRPTHGEEPKRRVDVAQYLREAVAETGAARVVLTGWGGIGKSTALAHLATALAADCALVPVIVRLQDAGAGPVEIVAAAARRFHTDVGPRHVERLIGDVQQRLILLLDDTGPLVTQSLIAWADAQGCSVVAARRDASPGLFRDFAELRLELLSANAVRDWLRREVKGPMTGDEVFQQIGGPNPTTHERTGSLFYFARLPLHLAILVDRVNREGRVPSNRAELFQGLVRYALAEREIARPLPSWSPELLRIELSLLAYEMLASGYQTAAPRSWVYELMNNREAGRFDEAIFLERVGFFLQPIEDKVVWSHQNYQDYFASLELERRIAEPAALRDAASRPALGEAFRMLASLRGPAAARLELLAPIAPLVAYGAWQVLDDPDDNLRPVIVDALWSALQTSETPDPRVLLAIGRADPPGTLSLLDIALGKLRREGIDTAVASAIVRAQASQPGILDEARDRLRAALADPRRRARAMDLLSRIGGKTDLARVLSGEIEVSPKHVNRMVRFVLERDEEDATSLIAIIEQHSKSQVAARSAVSAVLRTTFARAPAEAMDLIDAAVLSPEFDLTGVIADWVAQPGAKPDELRRALDVLWRYLRRAFPTETREEALIEANRAAGRAKGSAQVRLNRVVMVLAGTDHRIRLTDLFAVKSGRRNAIHIAFGAFGEARSGDRRAEAVEAICRVLAEAVGRDVPESNSEWLQLIMHGLRMPNAVTRLAGVRLAAIVPLPGIVTELRTGAATLALNVADSHVDALCWIAASYLHPEREAARSALTEIAAAREDLSLSLERCRQRRGMRTRRAVD